MLLKHGKFLNVAEAAKSPVAELYDGVAPKREDRI